jgi:hypothetical protein
VNGTVPKRLFVAFACLVVTSVAFSEIGAGNAEEQTLFVSIDPTKVCFISGNFTVAITRDWPRVIFKHETDPFSPTFEVSYPRMYAHNDSNGNGMFDADEATLTMFLDSNHVEWEMTSLVQNYSSELGGYASFGMRSELNAYIVSENETLVMSNWATLSFWFSITEKPMEYSNSKGTYVIDGGNELRMNFSLVINDCIDAENLVLAQFLQGGASTNMFTLLESDGDDHNETTLITGSIDERELEDMYPHEFRVTPYPTQEILFSKEDGVDQAFYYWGSEALTTDGDDTSAVDINSSYYTTGNGMMLHSILNIDNSTSQIDFESSAGIIESGFVGSVRDWIREYSETVLLVCAVVASLIAIGMFARRRRKRLCTNEAPPVEEPD